MTKAPASTLIEDEAAALRRREAELEAEAEQLENKRDAMRRRRSAAADANNGEQVQRILAGKARTEIKTLDVELARLDEEIRENAESANVVMHALIKHDRQAIIARLAEKFAAARAHLPKLEAALNQVEAVMQAAESDVYAFGQEVSAHGAFLDRFSKEIPFNPDEMRLLRLWRSEFVPFSEARAAATEEEVRDELFGSPTKLERWRQLAGEFHVELVHQAAWPERWTNVYTPLTPKRKGLANVLVRLRATMAGPDPEPELRRRESDEQFAKRVPTFVGAPGAIMRVSEEEAKELEAGRYAERVEQSLLNSAGTGLARMLVRLTRQFNSPQGVVRAGETAEVSAEEGRELIAAGVAEPWRSERQLVGALAGITADDLDDDEDNLKEK